MLAMWVKVRIKPDQREKFLDAIEVDALGSERDEPGCLRFNVLQDEKDPNVYYFFEVYKDQAALEAHRLPPLGGGGRTPRRSPRAPPLRDGLSRRAPLLGQGLVAPQRWPIARFATSTVCLATSQRLVSFVST